MPATVAQLLARQDLGLRLLTPSGAAELDARIHWAHSSDLEDPTPFLAPGQVLLITGAPDDVEPYVSRLVAHGIAGLGFGTEVVRAGTPDALVDACTRHGLPLFEVPYRTPFIAIARFVADRVAADTYARNTWALRASRAISLAALRPDALGAVLAELARQIDRPVALVGADGELDRAYPPGGLSTQDRAAITTAAEPLLRARRRAAGTTGGGAGGGAGAGDDDADDGASASATFALQTLGAAGRLRGVLAVGSAALDQAAQQVVTGVVALAGLALEQSRATDAARTRLRTAVWRALLAGDRALAETVAEPVLGALPSGPVRVAVLGGTAIASAADILESRPGLFFARDGHDLMVLEEDAAPSGLPELAARFDLRGGISAAGPLTELASALAQASAARDRADADRPLRGFDDIAGGGMLALLDTPDARAVATAAIAPLGSADADLPRVLLVWLDHNGVYDVAARELGMHRHTLRTRVAEAERILGVDLGSFAARADLFAALRAAHA
ncbi:PucR family transcriptional regulator [Leifsonia sp. PS1209]|uniref:PucR family transcriptional regulator n=1 Tax=Leifsonia sp. PS1209 TaxID=2724914 RepID=UPI001442CEDE|nr:PucR family transcriptional regulator [Leifsonia sp. PS1209]QIZ97616.1 PucR family transcriptional regulator [Leifsonia sp. PS1209]